MRQENSPFCKSYQRAELQNKKDKGQKKVWQHNFIIKGAKKGTPLSFPTEFGDARKKTDNELAEKRLQEELKEVWD